MACAGLKAETIVIISPSHRGFEPGIFLPESREFVVPNGSFEVDHPLLKDLAHSSTTVRIDDIPHLEELAIEMQLIFAARWFPRAKILPIIAGGIHDNEMERFFATLSLSLEARGESTLVVITSNMAISEEEKECKAKTKAFLDALTGPGRRCRIPPGSRPDSFCGSRIISGFLGSGLARDTIPECLGYSTSAAFADEGDPVVGYAALGFSR
jgi:AmmeMemoRadiSam system protein B